MHTGGGVSKKGYQKACEWGIYHVTEFVFFLNASLFYDRKPWIPPFFLSDSENGAFQSFRTIESWPFRGKRIVNEYNSISGHFKEKCKCRHDKYLIHMPFGTFHGISRNSNENLVDQLQRNQWLISNFFPKSGKDGPSMAMEIPSRQNKTMIWTVSIHLVSTIPITRGSPPR